MYLMDVGLGRTGKEGTTHAQWEKATWPKLKELTENSPDAGIHFQRMFPLAKQRHQVD